MKATYEEIEQVYLSLRGNVRNKHNIIQFENNYHTNLLKIVNRINLGYQYSKYHLFWIYDPKKRLIMSECLEDKIVNHYISSSILSKLDKYLIDSNVATRKNKGTSYARKLIDRYLCIMKNRYSKFYILKFDIEKYFYSINHNILLSKLQKYLNDEELREISKILSTTNEPYILERTCYRFGLGLPIGNMTSQILAIFYLNEIDHFIKENLKCKYYIRYMDDGIILHYDKNYLRNVKDILEKKLLDEYQLKFNSKTKIYTSSEGFTFLGIRYKVLNYKILRKIPAVRMNRIKKKIYLDNYHSYLPIFKYTRTK